MPSPAPLQLAVIDVRPGAALESQSGLQMLRPRIYGAWMQPPGPRRVAAIEEARYQRLDAWVWQRLEQLRAQAVPGSPRDQVFVVYRTHADPRFLDLTLDANDRAPGSVWGNGAAGARGVNYAASQMGRVTALTAWLSQWSPHSRADGPANLARTSVPVLLCTYTADQSTFPSTRDAWLQAGGVRVQHLDIRGGNHYLAGQPALVEQTADALAQWALKL